MSYIQYHSDTDNTAACMERTGQDIGVGVDTSRASLPPWRDKSDGQSLSLQTMAAGIQGGIPLLQFSDNIRSGNRHMGNRSLMYWVGELYAGRQDTNPRGPAAQGVQYPVPPQTHPVPLQLMPKKHKKKVPVAEEPPKALPEAAPQASEEPVPELATALPQAQSGGAVVPEEKKKKKKSRVQVALNALRSGKEVEEGVEAFRRYVEAEIGETALLHTLVERINRAQDLGDKKDAALRAVEGRIGEPDPESVPAVPQAAVARPRQVVEKAVVAPSKTALSPKEKALFECCYTGDVGIVRRLLRFGKVDVNMATGVGTPLCVAAFKGYASIVRELLSIPGIDVNLAQQTGTTPLYFAAQERHLGTVKLLLTARGINVNLAEINGNTPLCVAAQLGHEEIVRLLLAVPGIKIDVQPENGATSLYCAAQDNFLGIVQLFLKRGADVNLTLNDGTSPLCAAANQGNVEVVRLLLQAPAIQVNKAARNGVTALGIASTRGYKEIVRLLLEKQADPNITNDFGLSPLHVACVRGYKGIVEMLLNVQADMDAQVIVRETQKYTPYGLAQLGGQRGIMSLLERRRREKADQPGQIAPSTSLPPEPVPLPASQPTAQPGNVPLTPPIAPASQVTDTMEPTYTAPSTAMSEPSSSARPDKQPRATETRSPLDTAKDELIQEILRKLDQDNLESLEGIRLMVEVRATDSIDRLCGLYNRLAGIERQKERARRRKARHKAPSIGVKAMPPDTVPTFALGQKLNLSAEAVEDEIRRHLSQAHHRFVSQAVNDMEFGRGKPTAGYPGLWHASAGISGVGSCSVFYYINEETREIRIVGIGHHAGRAVYRLDYAAEGLGGSGRILRIA